MHLEHAQGETPWWTNEEIDIDSIDEAIEFIEPICRQAGPRIGVLCPTSSLDISSSGGHGGN
ncbi:MAG: hypothetical protein AAB343_03070 [Patescibacteria group bacterium]